MIHLMEFDSQHLLASTMMRFQERYESPTFRGRVFTREDFEDDYASARGSFSYLTDWSGFNIPDYVFDPFLDGSFQPMTAKERALTEWARGLPRPFYAIATRSGEDDVTMLAHEYVHGLFYRTPAYAAAVRATAHGKAPRLRHELERMGYCPAVIDDELNAYLITGLTKQMRRAATGSAKLAGELSELFQRWFGFVADAGEAEIRKRCVCWRFSDLTRTSLV